MANDTNETSLEVKDLSGAVQRQTTVFQMEPNEVILAVNGKFDRIGGVEKIRGYEQLGNAITTTSTSSSTSSTSSSSTSSSSTTTS